MQAEFGNSGSVTLAEVDADGFMPTKGRGRGLEARGVSVVVGAVREVHTEGETIDSGVADVEIVAVGFWTFLSSF